MRWALALWVVARADVGPHAPVRAATWSSEFEAVLRVDEPHAGGPRDATLLVAEFGTSAPLAAGSARLELHGAAEVTEEVAAGAEAGVWPLHLSFPEVGTYTGALTVVTPDRADALGLPPFDVHPEIAPPPPRDVGLGPGAVGVALALGLALGGALGVGWGRRRALVAAGLAGGVGLGITARGWAHGGEDHAPAAAPTASDVSGALRLELERQFLLELRTARVFREPFAEQVRALGTAVARPGGSAELRAPVAGTVAPPVGRLLVPGDVVSAGDVVATISEALGGPERSAYVEARSAAKVRLAEARKRLALAERDVARVDALEGTLSGRDRLERERDVVAAREEVRQVEEAAASLDASLPTVVLRAPLTGRISALLAHPGDSVAPADPLLRITDAGGLWVEAAVPETWAGRLQVGGAAELVADAHRATPVAGTVLDPGLEADPASGALRVVIAVAEPVDWLVPGMSVTASIAVGAPREAVVVPDAAVVDGAGETLVFVKTAPERFVVRPVRVGALSGGRREVEAGLEPGERVVVQGTYALRSLAGR